MVKFLILFRHPHEQRLQAFEAGYNAFLGMIEQIPQITRRQVVHVTGSPEGKSAYYRILELYFESEAVMHEALRSEAGQRAGAGLYEVFKPLGYPFSTAFAQVYEEYGAATPPTSGDVDASDSTITTPE